MKLIYQNFDGLDVSFKGALPTAVLNQLEEARCAAQERRGDVVTKLGPNNLSVLVGETGSRGGYRYRFDTGVDGETWFIAQSPRLDRWNIRVSAHSLALALHGYQGVKSRLLNILATLGALGSLEASISRVDYCFDFLTTADFMPDATRFIAHKNCKKARMGEKDVVTFHDAGTGERIESLRVGTMPGRQATIYNKTQEMKAHNKPYWKDIWGLDELGAGIVWRVEVRAGKDELNKWGLKEFATFEERGGDVIVSILEAMRYVTPTADSNRARWPMAPFWQTCIEKANLALAPYRSHANREYILRGLRGEVVSRYETNLQGHLIGYTAAQGMDISEITEVMEKVEKGFREKIRENPEKLFEKFRHAEEKFAFLK